MKIMGANRKFVLAIPVCTPPHKYELNPASTASELVLQPHLVKIMRGRTSARPG